MLTNGTNMRYKIESGSQRFLFFCFLRGISRVCPARKCSVFGLTLDIKLGQITHMYFKDLSQQKF